MLNTNEIQKEIKENIFTTFQISNLPTEEQENTLARISKIIFQAVLLRIVPSLDEVDTANYQKLLDEDSNSKELFAFFLDKVPQFLHIIKEETFNLAQGMLANMPKAILETKQEKEIDDLRNQILGKYKSSL